jgi:microcystin-dependent protein
MFLEPFIGTVTIFAGSFVPNGWMSCQGQLVDINENLPLFSIIGTTYGGDGISNFALPNLSGRVAIHAGQGPGLQSYQLGQAGGNELITLTTAQTPSHTHQLAKFAATVGVPASTQPGSLDMPTGNVPAPVTAASFAYSTAPDPNILMGSNVVNAPSTASVVKNLAPVNVVAPYVAMNYIICADGIFPPHN